MGILAVFIYGLLNRTSGKWAGVIGIVANAFLYHYMQTNHADMHFLYSMSYSLIAVLTILVVYGLIFKSETAVEFESKTSLDMTPSVGARNWGIVICIATVALYVVFW